MTILLKKLSFDNMFGYGENNSIDLCVNPITQLTAPNGSGKTTIALIIQELLYSKNTKGIKKPDIINRYIGKTNWFGKLEFSVGVNEYSIAVSRVGAISKVTLIENGYDISDHKIPETYKKLKDILGMDFEIFSQLTYQSSIDLLDFIKATDTNRKKFLINLFNLGNYIEIGEKVKVKLSIAEKELVYNQGELDGIHKFLLSTRIGEKRIEISIPIVTSELNENLRKLEQEISEHQKTCKKIDKNNLFKKEQINLNIDLNIKYPSETQIESYENAISITDKEIVKSKTIKETSQKQIKTLDLADTCYACGQPLDNLHALEIKSKLEKDINNENEKLESYESNLDNYKILLRNIKAELALFEQNQKNIERFEQLAQLLDTTVPIEYPVHKNLIMKAQEIRDQITKETITREEAVSHNESIRIHNAQLDTLRDQKRQFLASQELLNDDILIIKNRIKNLNILKKAFSTTGIVAFKLENLTKELEETINKYLIELSDGQFQVVFRLTGEKLNIIIIDNGKEAPIETTSGGEFSRIQTAILLAIRNILSKIGGNYVNLLFLDEITGVLDAAGKEKLLEILTEEMKLNVFIISHDFEHPLIDKISIVKENNISRIE